MFTDPYRAAGTATVQPFTPLRFLERVIKVHTARPTIAWNCLIWNYGEFGELVARLVAWPRAQVGATH